jgi:hypothetical protein
MGASRLCASSRLRWRLRSRARLVRGFRLLLVGLLVSEDEFGFEPVGLRLVTGASVSSTSAGASRAAREPFLDPGGRETCLVQKSEPADAPDPLAVDPSAQPGKPFVHVPR